MKKNLTVFADTIESVDSSIGAKYLSIYLSNVDIDSLFGEINEDKLLDYVISNIDHDKIQAELDYNK